MGKKCNGKRPFTPYISKRIGGAEKRKDQIFTTLVHRHGWPLQDEGGPQGGGSQPLIGRAQFFDGGALGVLQCLRGRLRLKVGVKGSHLWGREGITDRPVTHQ